jgi:hypothetical protein
VSPRATQLVAVLRFIAAHDTDYDARYPAVWRALSLALDCGLAAGVRIDPAEPEWPVVYIELPTGQVSWHMPQHTTDWDEHGTDAKYERIRAYEEQVTGIAANPADPDRACEHEEFAVFASVGRITDGDGGPVAGFTAEVRVSCDRCREPFRWVGAPAGLSPRQPMVSVDELELRAPIRPASSDPDFGLGIPGFAIRMASPGGDQ